MEERPRISCKQGCGKTFATKSSESVHRIHFHGVKMTKRTSIVCKETGCDATFCQIQDFRFHLRDMHGFLNVCESEVLNFKTKDDFYEWLAEEQSRTNTKYALKGGGRKCKEFVKMIYVCNRSGRFKSLSKGKRQLQAQGSAKIGYSCTSNITVRFLEKRVEINYFKAHYKHDFNLAHIPLPTSVKKTVAEKLKQGERPIDVLRKMRGDIQNVEGNCLKRQHILTRKDILNIKTSFGIKFPEEEEEEGIDTTNPYQISTTNTASEQKKEKKVVDKKLSQIDRMYDKLVESHKGKITKKHTAAIKLHKKGETMTECCNKVSDNEWSFLCKENNNSYKIVKNHECTELKCNVLCRICFCCLASYSCDCDVYAVSHKLCEHIHAVNVFEQRTTSYYGHLCNFVDVANLECIPQISIPIDEPATVEVEVTTSAPEPEIVDNSNLHRAVVEKKFSWVLSKYQLKNPIEECVSLEIFYLLHEIEKMIDTNVADTQSHRPPPKKRELADKRPVIVKKAKKQSILQPTNMQTIYVQTFSAV